MTDRVAIYHRAFGSGAPPLGWRFAFTARYNSQRHLVPDRPGEIKAACGVETSRSSDNSVSIPCEPCVRIVVKQLEKLEAGKP